MIVTFGIAKLPDGKVRLAVEKPQHSVIAERTYSSLEDVRRVLLDMDIPSDISDFYFKLLPDIEANQTLKFPPLYVPQYLLAAERLHPEKLQE
jgi:hypothetical protein